MKILQIFEKLESTEKSFKIDTFKSLRESNFIFLALCF